MAVRPENEAGLKGEKRMVRTAMIAFAYYPFDTRILREAEALSRAGIAVDVFCLKGRGETDTETFGNVTAFRIMKGTDKKENILLYFLLSFVFGVLSFFKLLSLSIKRRYSLIQVHNMPDFLVFAGLFHKIQGVPIILDLHDLTVELFNSKCKGKSVAALAPLVKLIERASCKFSDMVITTSSGFRNRLIERGVPADKITLVLNSADDKVFELPVKRNWEKIEDGPRLLYHGTVARRFGLHIAIEAVAKMKETMPGTALMIYGTYDPSYKAELEWLIKKLKLEKNVSLGGFLLIDGIIEAINNADFGVVPYVSDPFMNLALSTKIFEYVCMRLPVAAARLQSITSIFDERSITYFNPEDPADLAQKVLELCEKPEMRKTLSENAHEAYKEISWPVMSDRYLKAVNGLIS